MVHRGLIRRGESVVLYLKCVINKRDRENVTYREVHACRKLRWHG